MLPRRLFLIVPLSLAACSRKQRDPLPETLGGEWKRESVAASGEIPEPLVKLGCKQARKAIYQGPARVTVTLYEMPTGGSAFEAQQKWRPEAGSIPLQKDRYFAVVSGADAAVLNRFAEALEKTL